MDKITRAMLGDREAQEECTKEGVLLHCPFCGSKNEANRSLYRSGRYCD